MQQSSWRSALCAAWLALPAAGAAVEGEGGGVWRWPEVAAEAGRQPASLEAAARERGAAGAVSAAAELPNPVFGGAAGLASPAAGGASRTEWGVSVELPLDFAATRGPRLAAARAAEQGARHDTSAVRAQVLKELRRSFVALVHHQAVVEAGAELEAQVAQLAALVRRRADRGESRPTEVPRVEIEHERLRGALERSRATAEAERQRLSTWLGAPVQRAEGDLAQGLQLPGQEELLAQVLASNPVVQAARARVRAASAQASAERWERFPRFSLGAAHVAELDRNATSLSAHVSFPVWSFNGGKIDQADAAAAGEAARLLAVSRDLTTALAEAWQGCAAGQATAQRFREEVLPRAEGSARTLGRAFDLGETGLLDVIDARRVLLDTRREYLDLLLEMQNACGEVAALAGLELP